MGGIKNADGPCMLIVKKRTADDENPWAADDDAADRLRRSGLKPPDSPEISSSAASGRDGSRRARRAAERRGEKAA
jgi:hypothetical protein